MHNVLIVEDHDHMTSWLTEIVAEVFPDASVQSATTLAQARKLCSVETFAVALVDIGLPDGSGVDLLHQLTSGHQQACYPVMTTIYDDDKHLFQALQAGARGYLLKDQPRARLCEQLRGIARGEPPLSPSIARRLLATFQCAPPNALANDEDNADTHLALTPREAEVLRLIAHGFRGPEIAENLGISANTVSGYVKAIYSKLRISTRAEAAVFAVKHGLADGDV